MRKKFLYIKPINLEDQIEDKINKSIPIKTEESLCYFKDKINRKFDLNNNYFKLFSKKIGKNEKNNPYFLDNKRDINYLTKLNKTNYQKNNGYKRRILILNTINQKINKQKENKEYNSLTFHNNNINSDIKIYNEEETKKKFLNSRTCLHQIYNSDKRVSNYTYRNISSSLTINNNIKKENEKIKNNQSLKVNKSKTNKKETKKIKKIKDQNKEETNIFGMYDPASKSLRYKHYTENRIFNQSKNKFVPLNRPKMIKHYKKLTFQKDENSNYFDNFSNTKSINEINYMNRTLLKHRKENERNLSRLKKLIFMKKIESNFMNNKYEESKINHKENEQKIFKLKINTKIKNIINNERKKLEESIDGYNKKLKSNFNKKDLLFKILNKNISNLTEGNINETYENEANFDNMNILTNFHFKRETNIN